MDKGAHNVKEQLHNPGDEKDNCKKNKEFFFLSYWHCNNKTGSFGAEGKYDRKKRGRHFLKFPYWGNNYR